MRVDRHAREIHAVNVNVSMDRGIYVGVEVCIGVPMGVINVE